MVRPILCMLDYIVTSLAPLDDSVVGVFVESARLPFPS